jgi:hypothetical protein
MGQKTHPHGLRVGIHRKWNSSWYGVGVEGKNLFYYQRSIEQFFKVWMTFQTYTKIAKIKRILLVDLKMYKEGSNQFYIFVFFYKLRTKRRFQMKWKNKKNKKIKNISSNFKKEKEQKSFKKWSQIKN